MSRSKHIPFSFSRRGFLAGLGATAMTPFLPILNASGQEALSPKRLLIIYTPHGTVKAHWKPTGTENDWTISRLLKPLERHKAKINVLSGVNMQDVGVGAAHTKGLPLIWTGSKLLEETTFTRADGAGGKNYGWNSSLSVDQAIGNVIGTKTAYKTLEFGVRTAGSNPACRMIYTDARKPLAPANDPWAQFTRLFGSASVEDNQERLSALTMARDELKRLSPKIASEEREKVTAHIDALSNLEMRLKANAALCEGPTLKAKVDHNVVANTPAVVDAHIDLITAALACDLTRVASFQYTVGDTDNRPYPWLGINDSHHNLTHAAASDTAAWEKVMKIRIWYAEKIAQLLDKLDAVKEGNGTLLDNTLVVWGSELGEGRSHSFKSTPFLTAGGANCGVQTGRYLEYNEKVDHNRLLVAMCQAMGLKDVQKFGNVDNGSGPLARLLK